jgi:arylsulfatase A-like enzyme
MTKRPHILQAVLGAGLAIGAPSAFVQAMDRPAATPPNIVLLFVDDLGWGDIAYRRRYFDMPHLNQLMADGMTFTDAYAASPTCSPSRASVITGQHPARLRIVRHIPANGHKSEFNQWKGDDPAHMASRNGLPLDAYSYAKALKTLNYKTAFVGKWHLGHAPYHPIHQGFDEQYCVSDSGHPRSYYPPYFGPESEYLTDVPPDKYLTDQLTDDAVAYINKQNGKTPFQLTLFYYSTHGPYIGRKDFVEDMMVKNIDGKELQHAAMMRSIDQSLYRIREALTQKSFDDNTVIFFLGDQGGPFDNRPLRGGKQGGTALYEGGARIPFIIYWPNVTRAGSSSTEPVSTVDIFPTLLAMAGGSIADYPDLDGKCLTPLLTQTGGIDRDAIYLYRSYEDQYAYVRAGDWKMIGYRSGKVELFNLRNDLSEAVECSKENPDIVTVLKKKLYNWETRMGVEEVSGCPPDDPPNKE